MRKMIFNFLMRKFFKAVIDKDVIPWSDLPDETKRRMIDDAHVLAQSELFDRMTKNLKYRASEQMYNKSKCFEDMYFGKATLYVIDLLESKVKTLASKKIK